MSNSTAQRDEYDRFFQTTDTIESQARRSAKSSNEHGRPIRLSSKLSAVVIDPTSVSASSAQASRVYVSGSDGCVRRVKLGQQQEGTSLRSSANAEKEAVDLILRGPKAPLTCLSIATGLEHDGATTLNIFAGGWDKSIWMWTVRGDKQIGQPVIFGNGHSDFVKSVTTFRPHGSSIDVLVSGSADRNLCFWLASTSGTSSPLFQLKNHHKTSISCVLPDQLSQLLALGKDPQENKISVLSASSDGEILETELRVQMSQDESAQPISLELTGNKRTIGIHPTTVYELAWHSESHDLLTASADGTALIMKRGESDQDFPPWETDSTLKHGGHVRCVASQVGEGTRVYTGGRDESIKPGDITSGKVSCTFEGHFDEVTGIAIDGQYDQTRAISVSLDGTVRVWDQEEVDRISRGPQEEEEEPAASGVTLTNEEEAELAALMEDSE